MNIGDSGVCYSLLEDSIIIVIWTLKGDMISFIVLDVFYNMK